MQLNPAPGLSSSSAAHPSLPSHTSAPASVPMAVHASPTHAHSQSARPPSDYQGEFIKFTVPSMAEFDNWRLGVESMLTVDFVRGAHGLLLPAVDANADRSSRRRQGMRGECPDASI